MIYAKVQQIGEEIDCSLLAEYLQKEPSSTTVTNSGKDLAGESREPMPARVNYTDLDESVVQFSITQLRMFIGEMQFEHSVISPISVLLPHNHFVGSSSMPSI